MSRQKVCIQGLGFVGSAMAVAVANAKINNKLCFNVVGLDLADRSGLEKIEALNSGKFPFETTDKELISAVKKAKNQGNFKATSDVNEYDDADVVVVDINLDVYYKEDGTPYLNLTNFKKAIEVLAHHIKPDVLVLIETTVPPGTCEKVVKPILTEGLKKRNLPTKELKIAHSYERVMPGDYYYNSIINYWRVFSGIDEKSANCAEIFLKKVINTDAYPLTRLKCTTASETAKVLENSYRATTIAFMEEWGRFAEDVGIDMFEIVNAIRMRPTHSNMRQPGFGVGGYCLTKDPYFAKLAAKDLFNLDGHEFEYCSNSVKLNNKMPLVTLDKIKKYFDNQTSKKLLLCGVSYKQDVGDTRYSPSEIFVRAARRDGFKVDCYDPMISYWQEFDEKLPQKLPNLKQYDAVILTVGHTEFISDDFAQILKGFKGLIFDSNNVLTESQLKILKDNQIKFIGRGDF